MKKAFILAIVFALASCSKKETANTVAQSLKFKPGHGVFVVNRGGFQQANASVSYLNLDSLTIYNNLFYGSNGISMGDEAQSITIDGDKAYVVITNSQQVNYVNCSDFKFIKAINGFNSPAYLLKTGNSKAYVSDFDENKIYVINTQTAGMSGTIVTGAPTGKMVQKEDEVFAASPFSYNVYVINTSSNTLTDSIPVGYAPTDICMDKNGKLWVYSVGDINNNINPSLSRLDPISHNVLQTFPFTAVYNSEGSLSMNAAKDSLYFIHGDAYRMAVSDMQLPVTAFIMSLSKNFNSLIKTPDGRLLICDAKDSQQNGSIYVYSAGGDLLKTLDAGVIPSSIVVY